MIQRTEIRSFDEHALDIYARLNEPELCHIDEPRPGIFIAESPKVILRALDAGYRPVSLLAADDQLSGETEAVLSRIGALTKDAVFPLYTADKALLSRLIGYPLTRGVLCAMRRRILPDPTALLKPLAEKKRSRIAILENIVNPTNVGAIFRSAAALGIDAVLLTAGSADPLYRRAIRVSMGTVFQIPWTRIGNTGERDGLRGWPEPALGELRELEYRTAALALRKDSVSLNDPALKREDHLAIVLGTEGDGLSGDTIAACDYTVLIPMLHGVDSLNVAAASAVAFWELGKEREVQQ